MKIGEMKVNRIVEPMGFTLNEPRFSWIATETEGKKQDFAQIRVSTDEGFENVIFDSGKSNDLNSLATPLTVKLQPKTRYYWEVTVWADNGDSATGVSYFETSKMDEPWTAKWICADFADKLTHPVITTSISIKDRIKFARAYVCGVGLYEFYINGKKAGDEFLSPGYNAYDSWIQYQTYDITNMLKQGDNNISTLLGLGWYMGRFSLDHKCDRNIYGDTMALIYEIEVTYENGEKQVFITDESSKAYKSPIVSSSIYDGEVLDSNVEYPWEKGESDSEFVKCKIIDLGYERLMGRLSPPIKKMHEIKPVKAIVTPNGETVLDMGQNMVGWINFKCNAPKGNEIIIEHGEILHEGNFFRENLRSAKAEFVYTSNGKSVCVRPHFTFYGFRFVKITGWHGSLDLNDFTGCVLYSDIAETGKIETSNPLVNRLFQNAMWGQRGNFVDVPTDCPQRDERMGWTGDAQVFVGTACFNTDSYAFYNKYLFDLYKEQQKHDGGVPNFVPEVNEDGVGRCAWADAATVMPWTMYLHYGDKDILAQQFDSMKDWVDYVRRIDAETGNKRLWTVGFQFGDWLALDQEDKNSPFGRTDVYYIASAYYRYSSMLVAKAARVLGKNDIAEEYEALSEEVRQAILSEYITKNGRISADTQTGYILALWFDIATEEQKPKMIEILANKIKERNNHLDTGFVGTAYICKTLSDFGLNDLAYTLLLTEEYPSWLYEVNMGATTIWERWNSFMPDGSYGDLGMNSFNHYALGAIAEWMYRNVIGINPVEEFPGFKHTLIRPRIDKRLKYANGSVNTSAGLYSVSWEILDDGKVKYNIEIPFNATAEVVLENCDKKTLDSGKYTFTV